jgi:hypothetical protein
VPTFATIALGKVFYSQKLRALNLLKNYLSNAIANFYREVNIGAVEKINRNLATVTRVNCSRSI